MSLSIDIESFHVEGPGMDGTVDKGIKVRGDPSVIGTGQRYVHRPNLRSGNGEAMLMPSTPFHLHGDSSQAQGCEIWIEVTGPHRQVARLDRIVEG